MSTLEVELQFQDRSVARASLSGPGPEISIGRAEGSTLRAPAEDRHASKNHARLVHRDGRWWLESLSEKNPVRLARKAVTSHLLSPGERYEIGGCVLVCSGTNPPAVAAPSRLLHSGRWLGRRKFHLLQPSLVRVGRPGQGNEVELESRRISSRMAELECDPRGNWFIRVGGQTTNPVRVNGEAVVPGGRDRKLEHNDLLTFADVDLIFKDGRAGEGPSRALPTIALLAALLVTGVTLYKAGVGLTPSAEAHVQRALAAARAGDAAGALQQLERAETAKDAGAHEAAISETRFRLGQWASTREELERLRSALADSAWDKASASAHALAAASSHAWDFLEARAETTRQTADDLARLFDARRDMLALLLPGQGVDLPARTPDAAGLSPGWRETLARVEQTGGTAAMSCAALAADLRALADDVDLVSRTRAEWDAILDRLAGTEAATTFPDFQAIAAGIRAATSRLAAAHRPLEGYADRFSRVLPAIDRMVVLRAEYARFFRAATGMDLVAAAETLESLKDNLPPESACAVDVRLSRTRAAMRKMFTEDLPGVFQPVYSAWKTLAPLMESGPAALARLSGAQGVGGAARSHTLYRLPCPPRDGWEAPLDDAYDRVFGYWYFAWYLRNASQSDSAFPSVWRDLPPPPAKITFHPELLQAAAYLDASRAFLRVVTPGRPGAILRGGSLERKARQLEEDVRRADALAGELTAPLASRPALEAEVAEILSVGAGLMLGPPPTEDARRWLTQAFKANQRRVDALATESGEFIGEENRRKRLDLLRLAVPGTTRAHMVWKSLFSEP